MAAIEKNMTYHYRSTPTSAIPTSTIHGALIIVCHNLELTYYVTGNIPWICTRELIFDRFPLVSNY